LPLLTLTLAGGDDVYTTPLLVLSRVCGSLSNQPDSWHAIAASLQTATRIDLDSSIPHTSPLLPACAFSQRWQLAEKVVRHVCKVGNL